MCVPHGAFSTCLAGPVVFGVHVLAAGEEVCRRRVGLPAVRSLGSALSSDMWVLDAVDERRTRRCICGQGSCCAHKRREGCPPTWSVVARFP